MTSPQGPWQQNPQGGQPQYGTPASGYPQQNVPGYPQQYQQPQAGYQQQPYPQAGYQPNPYAAPPVSQQEASPLPRPNTINIAFWIAMVLPVLVTAVMAAVVVVTQGYMNDVVNASLEAEGIDPESSLARSAAQVGTGLVMFFLVAFLVVYVILSGLWILFGFKLRAGRNWARITLTIFAALWLLSGIGSLVSGNAGMVSTGDTAVAVEPPAIYSALSYGQSGLVVVGTIAFLVLVYLKPSNWFFQASGHRS